MSVAITSEESGYHGLAWDGLGMDITLMFVAGVQAGSRMDIIHLLVLTDVRCVHDVLSLWLC
jgi:hypothetical protein